MGRAWLKLKPANLNYGTLVHELGLKGQEGKEKLENISWRKKL